MNTSNSSADTVKEAQVIVHEDLPMVTIIREFDAPPDKVFRAHADPDLYMSWVGPEGLEGSQADRWDFRTGGEWRYVNRHEGQEHWFHGCFHEVRENELIVQTFTYEGFPDGVSLERLTLEDLGDGRTRLVGTSLVDSFEGRDGFVASGMEVGVQEGYRKLDRLLPTL
jgi:uncharacterized protein YndB with AHSA1/START domain